MGLSGVTEESVRHVLEEYDRLGAELFRSKHGFASAPPLVLVHRGRTYDAYAVLGAAHGAATGDHWKAGDFPSRIVPVAQTLDRLGFNYIDLRGSGKLAENARYGDLPAYSVGDKFANRTELRLSGLHRPQQAGICGTRKFGAESIVASGGYVDDEDIGDVIIYTGHGGQDNRKQQVEDQTFEDSGNAALLKSLFAGKPVRVIRGAHEGASFAPESGFRYDGLYHVVEAWMAIGKQGYLICRYTMIKVGSESIEIIDEPVEMALPAGTEKPGRRRTVVERVARSVHVPASVKRLYDDTCQACATRLDLPGGRSYSEGAHIRPLSGDHEGHDTPSNLLCLCPNCHVLFDNGAMIINAELMVVVNGVVIRGLTINENHDIDEKFLQYHRDRFGFAAKPSPT